MADNHLTKLEKYHIQWYLDNKCTLRKIAIALKRTVSTISRKIARCQAAGYSQYTADCLNNEMICFATFYSE